MAARGSLAYKVLTGRVPIETHKAWWNRNAETPVAIECRSWVDDRHIFTTLVWPSLESEDEDAAADHFERVAQVKQVLAKGATDMALTTRFDVDWDLTWDHERKCWVGSDGFAYDGLRETDIRSGRDSDPGRGHKGAALLSLGRPMPESEAKEKEKAS